MEANRQTMTGLLLAAATFQFAAMGYVFFQYIFPSINQMSLLTALGISGIMIGAPYHSTAISIFFLKKKPVELPAGVKIIAGRPFILNLCLTNPANHVVAASILIFVSLGLLLAGRI